MPAIATTYTCHRAEAPADFDGFIAWPNGLGGTTCSRLYEDTYGDLVEAREAGNAPETMRLERRVQELQAAGHIDRGGAYRCAYDPALAGLGKLTAGEPADLREWTAILSRNALPAAQPETSP